ncbi:MAG: methyl-accepting chemotaxis protein [Capsulimonadaceae bacterium]|nr:methyl-accepting chemotaxis protein [Capsulimonadaceae bacterium]
MNKLFDGSTRIMLRLKYRYKFAVIGASFLLPLAVVLFFFQTDVNTNNSFCLTERDGIVYCKPVLRLFEHVIRHENLAVDATLAGSASGSAGLAASERDVYADIADVNRVDARLGAGLSASKDWEAIKDQWEKTKSVSGGAQTLIDAHVALLTQITNFLANVGTNSNLILDPDIDSYYTMDSLLTQVPIIAANVAEARDTARVIAATHISNEQQRTRLVVLGGGIDSAVSAMTSDVARACAATPALKSNLGVAHAAASDALAPFSKFLSSDATSGAASPDAISRLGDDAQSRFADYLSSGMPVLDKLLEHRSTQFVVRRSAVDLCAVVFLGLAAYLFIGFYRAVTAIADSLVATTTKMATHEHASTDAPVVIARVNGTDELANVVNKLLATLEEADANLKAKSAELLALVGETQNTADSIVHQSREIATASNDLASRAADQTSSLDRTAARTQQITASVRLGVEHARNAETLARAALSGANTGAAVSRDAVEAIREVDVVSRQISSVVSTIEDLAFQTNLLALNASVEAARVGDAGRGFAVVAAEVRALASRCSAAAKEIKGQSSQIAAKVSRGSALAMKSGDHLSNITRDVTIVAEAISQIASGLDEQRIGIEQVNGAILQLDQGTQQNAALAEQFAACSQTMMDRSVEMSDLIVRLGAEPQSSTTAKAA